MIQIFFCVVCTTFAFYDYHDSTTIKSNLVFCSNRSHTVAENIASISFLEIFHLGIPIFLVFTPQVLIDTLVLQICENYCTISYAEKVEFGSP